jgi:serine/threonine-protein kinase
MPPLHAAPDDDEWGPDDEPGDERRSGARWGLIALGLVLLLLLGGGAYYVLTSGNRGREDTADATPATTTAGATGIFLDPSRYVGRPVETVQGELEALGLTVVLQPADAAELEALGREFDAGAVVRLDPADQTVPPASQITVTWTEEAFAPEEGEEPAPEPTTAAPTPTTTAPTTTATTPPPASTSPSVVTTPPTTLSGTPTTPPSTPTEEPPPSTADVQADGGAE